MHILRQHLHHCVADSLAGDNEEDKEQKTEEVIKVLEKLIGK
jgi:DNA-binding FrmR family transcriptional regulator